MTYALDSALNRGEFDENHAFLSRYYAYRQAFRSWTSTVVRQLSDDALHHCAQCLGTETDGELVGFAQREWPVLLDFALYCHRLAGESAVQRLRVESPSISTVSDQVLDAMCSTRVRVLDVDRVVQNVGFRGVDVWTGEEIDLVEPDVARRFEEGDRLVCRTIELPDLSLTTELLIPLSDAGLFRLVDELDSSELEPRDITTARDQDEYARVVYRCALDDQD